MSCYLLGRNHLNALVDVAMHGPADDRSREWCWREPDPNATGRMLAQANATSVCYRYQEPTATFETDFVYEIPARRMTLVEALKALECYEYQSCEHPEWMASEAREWCHRLRASLCASLPGWQDADGWEWHHA